MVALLALFGIGFAAYGINSKFHPFARGGNTSTEPKLAPGFKVTIPEGKSRGESGRLIKKVGVTGDYLKATGAPKAVARARVLGLPKAHHSLEGFLFPSTYELPIGADANELVKRQLDAFEVNFKEIDLRFAKQRNLKRYDVLKIASMIEREASVPKERKLISAVIYNRLRHHMPLGIDATTRFATNNWTRPLKESDLHSHSLFNTRLHTGLPPTPIGNPGLASIKAAAHPAKGKYLYYVVKPGTCGEHAFSSTNERFNEDVQKYKSARAKHGGKSPTKCPK